MDSTARTSDAPQKYDSLKQTTAPKGAAEGTSEPMASWVNRCCRRKERCLKKHILRLLLVPLMLAAIGGIAFRVYRTLDQGVLSTCYGRYEMCMELTYKDHIDHLPGAPADDFFFHRKDVTLSDQTLTNGVEAFWLSECVNDRPPFELSDSAPWFCKCTKELQFCAFAESSDTVLGGKDREEAIQLAYMYWNVAMYTWWAVGGFFALLVVVCILKKLCQKFTELRREGQEAVGDTLL